MVTRRTPAKKTVTKPKTAAKKVVRKPATVVKAPEKTLDSNIILLKKKYVGQQIHIITVPYEERQIATKYGAVWNADIRQFIFVGQTLPKELEEYATEDFSLERWIEDTINGHPKPVTLKKSMVPRSHQQEAIDSIREAAVAGWRGFIEADQVGLGKTISALQGASEVATVKGFTTANPAKLLITCPKAVIPHWRNTIKALGITNLRVVVINYDRAKSLLTIPSSAGTAKTTRTKNKRISTSGKPLILWDIIIADESHKLKNHEVSQRAKAFDKIARYADAHDKAPFIIWASATIGQTPVELGYLAPLIGQMVKRPTLTMKDYGRFLQSNNFHVKEGKVGFTWVQAKPTDTAARKKEIADEQKQDIERFRKLLFSPKSPSIRRNPEDIAGWPEINRIPMPYQLDVEQKLLYAKAWLEFRNFLKLNPRGKDPKGALAAQLRFRQKASMIMLPNTVEFATDLLENGLQVAISLQFMEPLNIMKTALEKKGYQVSEFSGATGINREQERIDFQKGKTQVILFTVEEGVSFHAGEQLPDGTSATTTPRATILHDIRYSAISCSQIEGRCHRDGQNANMYYPYAQGTVQQMITQRMIARMKNMKDLSGDDASVVEEIETLLETVSI